MPSSASDDGASSFDQYVVPEIPVLYRVALSLTRHQADAEDLVQDTLIRAYRAIDRFDGAHPRAWLLRADGDGLADTLDRLGTPAPPAEEVVVSEMFEGVVAEALAELPEKHRQVVQLVDIEGMSYQEAADAIGVPRGTVMSRLHRARARIRVELTTGRGSRPGRGGCDGPLVAFRVPSGGEGAAELPRR